VVDRVDSPTVPVQSSCGASLSRDKTSPVHVITKDRHRLSILPRGTSPAGLSVLLSPLRLATHPTHSTRHRAPSPSPVLLSKMATTTKYQPAPQRDSLDGPAAPPPGYSQAPPSYQDEPVVSEARTEDDNVPDDFKFGGSVVRWSSRIPIAWMPCTVANTARRAKQPYPSACNSSAKSTPSSPSSSSSRQV